MQLFGQIYLDENELLVGHLSLTKPARFHLFSYGKHHQTDFQELFSFI
ncbi:hypothetical protein [Lactobacillus amylolyticus]|nr:hypothetical protein [Lactobacillus amylolyticus]